MILFWFWVKPSRNLRPEVQQLLLHGDAMMVMMPTMLIDAHHVRRFTITVKTVHVREHYLQTVTNSRYIV